MTRAGRLRAPPEGELIMNEMAIGTVPCNHRQEQFSHQLGLFVKCDNCVITATITEDVTYVSTWVTDESLFIAKQRRGLECIRSSLHFFEKGKQDRMH